MIHGFLLNGKKPLVPPKGPGFRPRESLFGISLMTRSTDLNLNRWKPCLANDRLDDIQLRISHRQDRYVLAKWAKGLLASYSYRVPWDLHESRPLASRSTEWSLFRLQLFSSHRANSPKRLLRDRGVECGAVRALIALKWDRPMQIECALRFRSEQFWHSVVAVFPSMPNHSYWIFDRGGCPRTNSLDRQETSNMPRSLQGVRRRPQPDGKREKPSNCLRTE
jgi:hypothetical protein